MCVRSFNLGGAFCFLIGNNVKMGIVGLPNVGKSSLFNCLGKVRRCYHYPRRCGYEKREAYVFYQKLCGRWTCPPKISRSVPSSPMSPECQFRLVPMIIFPELHDWCPLKLAEPRLAWPCVLFLCFHLLYIRYIAQYILLGYVLYSTRIGLAIYIYRDMGVWWFHVCIPQDKRYDQLVKVWNPKKK